MCLVYICGLFCFDWFTALEQWSKSVRMGLKYGMGTMRARMDSVTTRRVV